MSYKHHKIIGIRKMRWDQLWHILYKINDKLAWDRVSKEEAMGIERRNKL